MMNSYELSYKAGCSCCNNDDDAWRCILVKASPDEFLEMLREELPKTSASRIVRSQSPYAEDRDVQYSDEERIHEAMLHISGVIISVYCFATPFCSFSGDELDEEYDIAKFGSIENILAGGSWEEVAQRHCEEKERREREKAEAAAKDLEEEERQELEKLREKYPEG